MKISLQLVFVVINPSLTFIIMVSKTSSSEEVQNGKFKTLRDWFHYIRDRDLSVFINSEPETQTFEIIIRIKLLRNDRKRQRKLAETYQYTAFSCFTVSIHQFSSISCTHELCKTRLLRPNGKKKTTYPRLRDPSAKKIKTPRRKNHPKTRLRDLSQTLPTF